MLAERVRRRAERGEKGTETEKAGADGADEDREREKVFPIFRKRTATSRASEKGGRKRTVTSRASEKGGGKRKARDTDKIAGSEPAALGEERDWNNAGSESPRHDPG